MMPIRSGKEQPENNGILELQVYSANGNECEYFPKSRYVLLSDDIPGDIIWEVGDYIMFKGVPETA